MIHTNEFKKGVTVEINDQPYVIVEFQHVKPGKGNAFTRTKFKNLITGAVLERTLKSGVTLPEADVNILDYDYLYAEGSKYVFMNTNTYEQIELSDSWVQKKIKYLKENMRIKINFHRDEPFDITLPNFVEMEVTYCEPGLKGDSTTSSTKPAKLESNLEIQVPLHIKTGDILKVDTRSGEYVEKVGSK